MQAPKSLQAESGPDRYPRGGAPLLDIMRFGAALLVMLNHLRIQFFASFSETDCASPLVKTAFFLITRLGHDAVVLFFVLSGFLVGGASVDKLLRGEFSPPRYAIDRFTRIYTPLVPALLFALGLCLSSGAEFTWGNFFVNLFSLQEAFGYPFPSSGALWSLSYEVWFYILCGTLICIVLPGKGRSRAIFVVPIILSGIMFSRLLPVYLFVWMAGGAAWFFAAPKRKGLFLSSALAIVAAGMVCMQLTSATTQADLSRFRFVDRSMAILILALGLALVVSMAARVRFESQRARRVAKAAAFLASFSYSLYLVHLPVEQLLLNTGILQRHAALNVTTLVAYCGLAIFMLLSAWGFYFCFERQTPLLRRWLTRVFA